MQAISYPGLLESTLSRLADTFEPNELAYLALTSKPEFAIRDKLAYRLHCALSETDSVVAREWKRTDLAILKAGTPEVLVELKAMYHFDVLGSLPSPHPYQTRVERDVEKALSLASSNTEVYALLLSTHPHGAFSSDLDGVIKYLPDINRAYRNDGSQSAIREEAIACVAEWFGDASVAKGSLEGGSAFGISVDVDYWLIGPYAS